MQTFEKRKEDISDRLTRFMSDKGLSGRGLASLVGHNKNSIYSYTKGDVLPKSDFWIGFKEAFPEIDLNEFIAGEAGFGESRTDLVEEEQAGYGVAKVKQRVYVAQAGNMIDVNGYDGFVELEVSEDYPTDKEFGRALFLIEGESMVPTLEPGWLAWAERITGPDEFENGAVYMVLSGGRLQCKRVFLDPHNEDIYTLASDNKVIRDMDVLKRGAKLWRVLQYVGNRNLGGG